jgi:hypothetical protein
MPLSVLPTWRRTRFVRLALGTSLREAPRVACRICGCGDPNEDPRLGSLCRSWDEQRLTQRRGPSPLHAPRRRWPARAAQTNRSASSLMNCNAPSSDYARVRFGARTSAGGAPEEGATRPHNRMKTHAESLPAAWVSIDNGLTTTRTWFARHILTETSLRRPGRRTRSLRPPLSRPERDHPPQ